MCYTHKNVFQFMVIWTAGNMSQDIIVCLRNYGIHPRLPLLTLPFTSIIVGVVKISRAA